MLQDGNYLSRELLCRIVHQDARFRLRPGASGFPARGDAFFASCTIWSRSAFGTARIRRMMPLNFRNSEVERNCSGLSSVVSSGSAWLTFMSSLHFSSELLVSQATANNMRSEERRVGKERR